ncbi:type II 3-dehydroquinate dehydratase, partial [Geobacillus sp. MR]|nr:type II 3-dehydroquinate dehydratase [Geobacillus sp. MR]
REPFRKHSYVSPHAQAVIAGAGITGYRFAVQHLTTLLRR